MQFITKLHNRTKQESGFTLIELLVVLVIIGILLAIAVPSYLGFKDRANQKAASANVRSTVPTAEAYYSDFGTYAGMTPTTLKAIDSGISATVTVPTATATTYCIQSNVANKVSSLTGPGGVVTEAACA